MHTCIPSQGLKRSYHLCPRRVSAGNKHTLSMHRPSVRGGNTECTDTGCLGTVYRYGSKCTGIPEPTQGAELSLSLSLTRTHMHARAHTHTHTHMRAHTHAHTHIMHTLPPSPTPPPPPPPRTYLFPSFYLHVTSSSYLPSVSVYRSCQYALGSATRNPLNLA